MASAAVESATATVDAARAQEQIASRESERIESIRELDPTAISLSDRDRAEAAQLGAIAQFEAAESERQRALAAPGPAGDNNPGVRAAMAGLEQAELNLARTTIVAPSGGAIETFDLDVGHFAATGPTARDPHIYGRRLDARRSGGDSPRRRPR